MYDFRKHKLSQILLQWYKISWITRFCAKLWILGRYPEIKNRAPQTSPFRSLYAREHYGTLFSCFGSQNRVSLTISLPHLTVPWPRTGITPDADWIPSDGPFSQSQTEITYLALPCATVGRVRRIVISWLCWSDLVSLCEAFLNYPTPHGDWKRWCRFHKGRGD